MFTSATLAEARAHLEKARTSMRAQGKQATKSINPAVAAIESAGVAYAIGASDRARVLAGREPDDVGPLLFGALMHVVGLASASEVLGQHALALGNGALSACAYRAAFGPPTVASARVEPPPPPAGRRVEITVARVSITSWP